MNGWYVAIKVLKNALCFIMGYLVAMVIRVMLFLLVQFCILYIVQVKSMCVPILRSIGSELTKLENMQQLYILFDVTWRKNGTSYVMGTTTLLIGILIRNILKQTRRLRLPVQSYGSSIGFHWWPWPWPWPWPLTYVLFSATRTAHGVLESPCEVLFQY